MVGFVQMTSMEVEYDGPIAMVDNVKVAFIHHNKGRTINFSI